MTVKESGKWVLEFENQLLKQPSGKFDVSGRILLQWILQR